MYLFLFFSSVWIWQAIRDKSIPNTRKKKKQYTIYNDQQYTIWQCFYTASQLKGYTIFMITTSNNVNYFQTQKSTLFSDATPIKITKSSLRLAFAIKSFLLRQDLNWTYIRRSWPFLNVLRIFSTAHVSCVQVDVRIMSE